MKTAVRYFSKTGNTKKLALAIADAIGVDAQDISTPLKEPVDVLFLGSAVYAADIDDAVKQFISSNKANIGTIYNFSTAAVASSTYRQVKKVADAHGIAMAQEEFHCRGAFTILHRNRPNAEDFAVAAAFARSIVK